MMEDLTPSAPRGHEFAGALLTPTTCALLLVDYQPQMAFAVQSAERAVLVNNVAGLARTAEVFQLPTVLTTVSADGMGGALFPEVQEVFPRLTPFERTAMNAWDDPAVVEAVHATGRQQLLIAGLWTEISLTLPALSALDDGFDVFVVADASAGVSEQAHTLALQRVVQAGAVPVTWLQVLLELQRDWARHETAALVGEIIQAHGGASGIGARYGGGLLRQPRRRASDSDGVVAVSMEPIPPLGPPAT